MCYMKIILPQYPKNQALDGVMLWQFNYSLQCCGTKECCTLGNAQFANGLKKRGKKMSVE